MESLEGPESLEQLVSRGPAATLRINQRYLVLPEMPNPYDYPAMKKLVEHLSNKERIPCICLDGEYVPAACILLQKHRIVIKGNSSRKLSYQAFYECLATMPSVKTN